MASSKCHPVRIIFAEGTWCFLPGAWFEAPCFFQSRTLALMDRCPPKRGRLSNDILSLFQPDPASIGWRYDVDIHKLISEKQHSLEVWCLLRLLLFLRDLLVVWRATTIGPATTDDGKLLRDVERSVCCVPHISVWGFCCYVCIPDASPLCLLRRLLFTLVVPFVWHVQHFVCAQVVSRLLRDKYVSSLVSDDVSVRRTWQTRPTVDPPCYNHTAHLVCAPLSFLPSHVGLSGPVVSGWL